MPYKSEKQRRFMHAKHSEIAARWDKEYGTVIKKEKKGGRRTRPGGTAGHRKRSR